MNTIVLVCLHFCDFRWPRWGVLCSRLLAWASKFWQALLVSCCLATVLVSVTHGDGSPHSCCSSFNACLLELQGNSSQAVERAVHKIMWCKYNEYESKVTWFVFLYPLFVSSVYISWFFFCFSPLCHVHTCSYSSFSFQASLSWWISLCVCLSAMLFYFHDVISYVDCLTSVLPSLSAPTHAGFSFHWFLNLLNFFSERM